MERKNKLKIVLIIVFLIIGIMTFSNNYREAFEVYNSGLNSYRTGNYENAFNFFKKAMLLSSELEDNYPEIKLYFGLSAFFIQDFSTAENYLILFPENPSAVQALKNISESNFENRLNFSEIKIESTLKTEDEEKTFNSSLFILITLIIFIISFILIVLILFVFKITGFGSIFKSSSINKVKSKEKTLENDEEIDVPDIVLEQVINLKLDNLDGVLSKSKALNKLLGEIEGEEIETFEDFSSISSEDEKSDVEKTESLKNMIGNSLKEANIDEIESLIQNIEENGEVLEENDFSSKKESAEEKLKDKTNEEFEALLNIQNDDNDEFEEEEKVEKEKNASVVEKYEVEEDLERAKENIEQVENAINPENNLKLKYNSLMKEKEKKLYREAEDKELTSLIEEINEINLEKGSKTYSNYQLEKIFSTIFFDVNEKVN
jgi:hypothetical protein